MYAVLLGAAMCITMGIGNNMRFPQFILALTSSRRSAQLDRSRLVTRPVVTSWKIFLDTTQMHLNFS
jgi:hypothetical protein